jgi:CysZ protein
MRGFFGGIAAFFGATGWIASSPRLWPRALVPVITALVLVVTLGWFGAREALALAHRAFGEGVAAGFAGVLGVIAAVLLALVIAVSLAQPLSGWALEGIVRAQEEALGVPPGRPPPYFRAMLASLASALLALVVGIPTIALLAIAGWVFPPAAVVTVPLKVLVAALLLAWDLLDYPLASRDMGARARLRWCGAHFGAVLGFGLSALLVTTVPGLGLLALPCGVAAAVRLASKP